jgi:hypothetical protein
MPMQQYMLQLDVFLPDLGPSHSVESPNSAFSCKAKAKQLCEILRRKKTAMSKPWRREPKR